MKRLIGYLDEEKTANTFPLLFFFLCCAELEQDFSSVFVEMSRTNCPLQT